jgi:hypothetical protein
MSEQKETDHDSCMTAKKRGRPKKAQDLVQEVDGEVSHGAVLSCRYKTRLRSYHFTFSYRQKDENLEVYEINVLSGKKPIDLEMATQRLGQKKIANIIKTALVKKKLVTRLEPVWFSVLGL